jgi:Flp pilus assembly protein TadG
VELALVLPILLLLAVSVFDYGYYLEHVNNLTTVVRDGARYASINTATFPWSAACASPTYTQSGGGAGSYDCPFTTSASNTVEAVIQYEAESLTVPEGGLPLDNVDCTWGGGSSTTPPSAPSSTAGLPAGSASCMTIAYYTTSNNYATLSLCGYYSAGLGAFQGTASVCTAAGALVQVTIVYDLSETAPGPAFDVMNSMFGIQVKIVAQYALVVTQ